jgi:hypothetical protein
MSDEQLCNTIPDGHYRLDDGEETFIAGFKNGMSGDERAEWLREQGYTFEPVVVLGKAAHDELQAERAKLMQRIETLERELAQVNGILALERKVTDLWDAGVDTQLAENLTIFAECRHRIAELEAKLAEREAYEVVDTIETEWGYQLACVTEHPDGEITLQTTGYSIADPDQQFSIRMPKQYRLCRKQSEASDE